MTMPAPDAIPVGLSLDEARALALGTDPWWHTMLEKLPLRCPTCHRAVLPAATEPANAYGLGAHVYVSKALISGRMWFLILCCAHVLAEGYKLAATEDPRR